MGGSGQEAAILLFTGRKQQLSSQQGQLSDSSGCDSISPYTLIAGKQDDRQTPAQPQSQTQGSMCKINKGLFISKNHVQYTVETVQSTQAGEQRPQPERISFQFVARRPEVLPQGADVFHRLLGPEWAETLAHQAVGHPDSSMEAFFLIHSNSWTFLPSKSSAAKFKSTGIFQQGIQVPETHLTSQGVPIPLPSRICFRPHLPALCRACVRE